MFDLLFGWRKASKCKKLIRRVQCRLKLLKNKRSCIVKQLREDVAELLKNGHHQTAFDRVEQVVMDENMVQMYDLLYQYCEFVVINLPYIRKHRDCPNDINEAISTLVFSSTRFGELPELLSIRKLFGERYGRKFVSAAVELLPGNLVKHQIVENLEMKTLPDNVKHIFLDETARSCIQTAPLLLEYKPELQENQKESKILLDEFEYSSEYSAKLGEELIYLDDIEEFVSPMIKDGSLQDQRCFVFKSFGVKTDHSIDIDGEETPSKRKRSRISSLVQESLSTAAYYGESDETSSSPEIRRKSRHHRAQQSRRRDEVCGVSSICRKCSLARPCFFCSREVNKALEAEESDKKQTPLRSTMRAITMPCERPKDSNARDNIDRSNSYPFSQSYAGYSPCQHIHPKLPDYDELAAKFMELKRENLHKK